jgi:superfamily I DNA and RNA helicase
MVVEYNINEEILDKHPSSKNLIIEIKSIATKVFTDALVYHNFPLYIDNENNSQRSDILVVSKTHGIFLFKSMNVLKRDVNTVSEIKQNLDSMEQIFSLITSKLIRSKLLRKNPLTLKISLIPAIYFFYSAGYSEKVYAKEELSSEWDDLYVLNTVSQFQDMLKKSILDTPLDKDVFDEIVAVLEGSKGIIKQNNRIVDEKLGQTKGKQLNLLESTIARFDNEQKGAALKVLKRPQRIRGLAGSGKTIILAMKVAQIHLTQPDAFILYTYSTKSLHSFIKQLITRFYRQFADKDPDWSKIDIMHAWGGKNLEGVYYNACKENNVKPMNFGEAKLSQGRKEAFNYVCSKLFPSTLQVKYDYSILDEAQDFPVWFYRVVMKLTRDRKVIWGYDECQNILGMELQDPAKTFGMYRDGTPAINLEKIDQDIVLHTCYRNYKTILVAAFALGLGIYNDTIIQLPENLAMWEDLGFEVEKGDYTLGTEMVISRPDKHSLVLPDYPIPLEESVKCKSFASIKEECVFVSSKIIKNITEEELQPEDILVICLNDSEVNNYLGLIESELDAKNINSFNVHSASSYNTSFRIKNCVTLSTIYTAKGNESGMVYIVGADKILENKNSIIQRNKLFTAITRAKLWVRITGQERYMKTLQKELDAIISHDIKLVFKMPNLRDLNIFQRDLQKQQEAYNRFLRELDKISKQTGVEPQQLLDEYLKQNVNN